MMDLVEQLNQEEHAAHQRHAGTPGAVAGGTVPAAWAAGGPAGADAARRAHVHRCQAVRRRCRPSPRRSPTCCPDCSTPSRAPAPVATPAPVPDAAPVAVRGGAADLRPPGRGPLAGACCAGEALPRCRSSPWVAAAWSRAPVGPQQSRSRAASRRPARAAPATACPAAPHRPERAAPRRERRAGGTGAAARRAGAGPRGRLPMHPPSTGGCCPGWSPDRPHR